MKDMKEFVNNVSSEELETAYKIASSMQKASEDDKPGDVIHFLLYLIALMEIKMNKIIDFLEEDMKK